MARRTREVSGTGIYHVMMRGINRQDIFEDSEDYTRFIKLLFQMVCPVDDNGKALPSRGIIGLRTNVLTASQGEAIMAHRFKEYQPYKGDIERRVNGSMIALETGTAYAYSIDKLQDRGKFFIDPGEEVYMGQVVGEHVHDNDLVVNVAKAKQLTNVRASGSDDKARIIPKTVMSLEECLEYIKEDEYVEVTPLSMRMRKIILDHDQRKKQKLKNQ